MDWLKRLGVRRLRTGISWADWHRPNAPDWFDRQMDALRDFDVTVTLCFTPPSGAGRTTPARRRPHGFAWFAAEVAERYVVDRPLSSVPVRP